MGRKRKQTIKVNNVTSLEGLMQETYNETCQQINEASKAIAEIVTKSSTMDEMDVDDLTKISKSKEGLLKIKENSIKLKLELSKLQNDTIKYNGVIDEAITSTITATGGAPGATLDDFAEIRKMFENKDK